MEWGCVSERTLRILFGHRLGRKQRLYGGPSPQPPGRETIFLHKTYSAQRGGVAGEGSWPLPCNVGLLFPCDLFNSFPPLFVACDDSNSH